MVLVATATAPGASGAAVTTPAVPSTLSSWGIVGPVAGTPTGTLLGDGTVRTTLAPATALPLSPVARALVLGSHDYLTLNPRPSILTDDSHAVGSVVTAATTTARTATLWALDLGSASLQTRDVPDLPLAAGLLGSTGTAWVTAAAAGPVTLWPFDGSAPSMLAPSDLDRAVAVGSAGLLYLTPGTDALGSRLLRLAPLGGGPAVTVADLSGSGAQWTALVAATSGGAVGWTEGAIDGYWDAVTGAQRTTATRIGTPMTVVVQPGTVSVLGYSPYFTPGAYDLWSTWTSTPTGLVPASPAPGPVGQLRASWSSATPTGGPALGLLTVTGNDTFAATTAWWTWPRGSAAVEAVAAPGTSATVIGAVGSLGHLLMTYQTGRPDLPSSTGVTVVLRKVTPTGTTALMSDQRAVTGGGPLGAGFGVSGSRTAIPDYVADGRMELVLRDRWAVTGRVPLGTLGVSEIAMSGPWTLYAVPPATGGAPYTVRWTDAYGRTQLVTRAGTTHIAQDGPLSAYQTTDGWVWVRDENAPASRTNPVRVMRPAGRSVAMRTQAIWLSAGRLVVEIDGSLLVTDMARRTTRSIASPWTCDQMTGHVLACRDQTAGRVLTLDTAAPRLVFRAVAGATLPGDPWWTPTAFVGRLLAAPSGTDPATGATTTIRVAALPTANRDSTPTRVLGPLAPTGNVVSGSKVVAFGWCPAGSFTDPVSSFAITLRGPSGKVVRTWKGSAPDGAIRASCWWPFPPTALGTYRWTLTGTSAYGAVLDAKGTGAATGTFRVVRMEPTAIPVTAPARVVAGTSATITARLVLQGGGAAVPGHALGLYRNVGGNHWRQVATATTNRSGGVAWHVKVDGTTRYQVRHEATITRSQSASVIVTIRV